VSEKKYRPERTLVFPVRGDEVLLGRKKRHHARSFGVGKWNGFGGKVEVGESLAQAAIRECREEAGITPTKMEKVAVNNFFDDYGMVAHVFLVTEWDGEVVETEEMQPQWFKKSELPFDEMWDDDIFWVPPVLAGKKIHGNFHFASSDDSDGTAKNPLSSVEVRILDEIV
jgi:mutator protein MutT